MVSWRRGLTMLAMAVSIIGLDGPAYAGSIGAGGTATANAGTVTLTRSLNLTTQNADFALTFQGRVTDHGWSYVGTLTGTGSTWGYGGEVSQPPYLAMTSGDGSVSGWCSGGSETGVLGADTLNMATPDMEFQCVLARNGGTPWAIKLDAVAQQPAAIYQDTWSGRYVEADVTTQEAGADGNPTYGQVQLGSQTSDGAGISYGPLRFSGQIALGSFIYQGDLVSGTSAYVQSSDIPPLSVSGTSRGVTVTGTCTGSPDPTISNVTPSYDFYDFSCSLAAGTAPTVTVALRGVFDTSAGACSFRDCWGDEEGWFTATDGLGAS